VTDSAGAFALSVLWALNQILYKRGDHEDSGLGLYVRMGRVFLER
jgi:hypothetical protein